MTTPEITPGTGDVLTDDKAYADELARMIREGIMFADDLDGKDAAIFAQFYPEGAGEQDA